MYKNTLPKDYTDTAITFARLYGIAETLCPWEYLDNDRFTDTIRAWTEKFLCMDNPQKDILKFFEMKIDKYQKEQDISVIR